MGAFLKRRALRIAILVAVIGLGIVWRKADLGLPFFWWKYGGSALWGVMVAVIVGVIDPAAKLGGRAIVAILVAALVEFSRLYHTPGLDAFRATLAGQLLLGRVFSLWNILAYAVGIVVATGIEAMIRRR